MAVAQQMSGADYEMQSIVSGYGHSADGCYDGGRVQGRRQMGDFFSDLLSQGEDALQSAGGALLQSVADSVTGEEAEAAPVPAPQPSAKALVPAAAPKPVVKVAPMSPKTKKILMFGGAAVLAAIVLPKVLKRR